MTSINEEEGLRQRTLAAEFTVCGKGIHTGEYVRMTVFPAEPDVGICFLRSDQPPSRALVLARWSNVVNAQYSTDVGNAAGVTVRTVEHLMAAFRLAGVDNALVELDGPEVPAVDGSADPFIRKIEQAGTLAQDAPGRAIIVLRPVQVKDGNRFARLSPSHSPRLIVTIDYPGTTLGMQSISATWSRDVLKREIAPARTFGFAADHTGLMERGHALGADLGNTVVVDGAQIRNLGGLRYRDEFVRHKMLDAIGDLYLAGWPIRGNYEGYRPGHTLNVKLIKRLFEQPSDAWTLVPPLASRPTSPPRILERCPS